MPELDTLPIDPDYGLRVGGMDGVLRERRLSGAVSERAVAAPQRIFTLPFRDRSTDDVELLRDFKRSMKAKHFRFDHKVYVNNAGTFLPQSFPVHWLDDTLPEETLAQHETLDFEVRLLEAAGKNLVKNNYLSSPLDLSVAAWTKNQCSISGNRTIEDPSANGIYRATRVTPDGGATNAYVEQLVAYAPATPTAGQTFRVTVALKAASGTPSIKVQLVRSAGGVIEAETTANLTTSWQTFTFTGITALDGVIVRIGGSNTWPVADGDIDIYLPKLTYEQTLGFFPGANAAQPGIFIEEFDAVTSGTWPTASATIDPVQFHGRRALLNANTGTSEYALFTYEGYGFEIWSSRSAAFGIGEVLLDDVLVGELDHYDFDTLNAAAIFEWYDVPLGIHRVKIRATNRKNAASSAKTLPVDALKIFY